ncbi:hypothetical protein LEN26_008350 [Aphanomyces euteiches]|nr:hypothetical protein AeMF1_004878 [Aphanomyces euteiches]KAH9130625.1 hypothetical protein LEN26_008350 [Aphanomyces euteiches]KAH9186269.1 hypothetical protein AeNC1_011754 [Aphanomyces euteiches]
MYQARAEQSNAFDRQWDIRLNLKSAEYLEELVAAIVEHFATGRIKYVLVSGVEIGTKPNHSDYQVEHVHIALILHDRMTSQAILKKWNVDRSLSFYMVPRNRELSYEGWKKHHTKEFSKKDPAQLITLEKGELPSDGKRKAEYQCRSEEEKKMKTDDVIREMKTLIESGKSEEAFTKYPRNYMMYGEKLKSMISQKKKTFFGKFLDPHLYVYGFPGSGKTSIIKFLYPGLYKKDLSNRFWDLYDENIHTHVLLEDLDSPTVDKLGTPQPTRAVILVSSNQNISQLINGLDETKCIEDTKKAIRRRFFEIRIDDLLRLLGLKLIPEYERKLLNKEGNEDAGRLFMPWNYALDCPTGDPLDTAKKYQQMIRDFYYKQREEEQRRRDLTKRLRGTSTGTSSAGAGTSNDVNIIEDEPMDAPQDPPGMDDGGISAGISLFASSKGGRTDGSESGVDPFYAPRLRPFMDTQNTILPYYKSGLSLTLASGATSTAVKNFTIRINSIWDILTTVTYAEDPAPAAATADGTNETPIMREWWQNIYRYWTVLRADYKVRFWTNDKTDQEADIWCYHHGQQVPPITQGGSGGAPLYSKYRRLHRHAHFKTLGTFNSATTENGLFRKQVTFTGTYKPGNNTIHNDVFEDEYKETWHRTTEVPSLHEMVTFIAQRSERSGTGTDLVINYDVEVVYHVQWKDLESKFQYLEPAADETFTNLAAQG